MTVLDKPIDELDAEDIRQLCQEQRPEGPQLEFKQDVPTKGPTVDSTTLSDHGRNSLTKEIVAFSNTYGGTMVVGVVESSDKPNRATAVSPLTDCAELARRLRQAVHDIVDPPLPLLEATGVVTENDGTSGVVVMRVGKSRRAPHRSTPTKDVYVRREDESVRVDMREIQELTMSRLAEVQEIDKEIGRQRKTFSRAFNKFDQENAFGLHYTAIPTAGIDLGRVVKRPEIYARAIPVEIINDGQLVEKMKWPFGEFHTWRPALRAVKAVERRPNLETHFSLNSRGVCEFTFFGGGSEHAPFYASWFVSSIGLMLDWIDRVRRDGGFAEQEYALATTLLVSGSVGLRPYGDQMFAHPDKLSEGLCVFPIYPVNSRDGFDAIIGEFNEDFWNVAHVDPSTQPTFRLSVD